MWSVIGSMRSVMNRTTAFDRGPLETIEVVSLRIPTMGSDHFAGPVSSSLRRLDGVEEVRTTVAESARPVPTSWRRRSTTPKRGR
jgi:hypothetical protein